MDHSLTGLPKDDGEAAEANRKDREARSIAIEKVKYTYQNNDFIVKNLQLSINSLEFHSFFLLRHMFMTSMSKYLATFLWIPGTVVHGLE